MDAGVVKTDVGELLTHYSESMLTDMTQATYCFDICVYRAVEESDEYVSTRPAAGTNEAVMCLGSSGRVIALQIQAKVANQNYSYPPKRDLQRMARSHCQAD